MPTFGVGFREFFGMTPARAKAHRLVDSIDGTDVPVES